MFLLGPILNTLVKLCTLYLRINLRAEYVLSAFDGGKRGKVFSVTVLTLMTLARASAPFQERLHPVRLMELMDVWFLMPLQSTTKGNKKSQIKDKNIDILYTWYSYVLTTNN